MKRIVRLSAVIVASIVVCAALAVGVWWMFSVMPTPAPVETPGAGGGAPAPGVVNVVPRMMAIPWKRDPEVLPERQVTPIPLLGAKGQKMPRPVPGWWTPPAGVANVPVESGELDGILSLVKSEEQEKQGQGVAKIEELAKRNPLMVARMMAGVDGGEVWSGPLLAGKRYGDVERIASEVMVPASFNVDVLEGLCAVRVAAAEGMGRPVEGLLREWFSVSSLRGTLQVEAQVRRLMKVKAVPEGFVVDPEGAEAKGFAAAAGGMDGEDYASLLSRANLWLLAGKAEAAEPVFRRGYMLAPEPQVMAAAENFARVVKARTGSVEETNKWLQEHGK